jgi:hypothetical protein
MGTEGLEERSEEMMNPVEVFLFVLITFITGCLVGGTVTSGSWEDHCQKAGLRVAGDKVYECKVKKNG